MKILTLLSILILFFFTTHTSNAAVKPKKISKSTITAGGQYLKAKNTVRAFFGSLKGISKVNYTLMYTGNGIGQGMVGSFTPGKKTFVTKDLYLGTCSRNVCVNHKNIKNIQLEIVAKYSSGKSTTKVIKVR